MRSFKLIAVVVAATLGALTAWIALMSLGFCPMSMTFLSDERKLRRAVQALIEAYPEELPPNAYSDGNVLLSHPVQTVPYRDFEDFIDKNPGCCTIDLFGRDHAKRPLIETMTGRISGYAYIDYKIYFIDTDGLEKFVEANTIMALTNCGCAWSGLPQ